MKDKIRVIVLDRELDIEEARELYQELHELFQEKRLHIDFPRVPAPWTPDPWNPRPWATYTTSLGEHNIVSITDEN